MGIVLLSTRANGSQPLGEPRISVTLCTVTTAGLCGTGDQNKRNKMVEG